MAAILAVLPGRFRRFFPAAPGFATGGMPFPGMDNMAISMRCPDSWRPDRRDEPVSIDDRLFPQFGYRNCVLPHAVTD
ncbi:MAG TPA: hypothetical protein VI140_10365 [Oxalicibacterium sp.]